MFVYSIDDITHDLQ